MVGPKYSYDYQSDGIHLTNTSYRLMGDSRARTYLENARSWAVQDIWRLMAEESLRLMETAG